jgi:hypothetical protein
MTRMKEIHMLTTMCFQFSRLNIFSSLRMDVAVIRQTACYSNLSPNTNLGPHLVLTPNEWLAGCHAWLTFSAMQPTKLAMSELSDLVTPLGYSPNLKVQFWKSLSLECEEGRKASKQSICLMNIWHHISYLPPFTKQSLLLTSTSSYIFFYQMVHLYYTTWRWTTFYWFECPFNEKEFQTATKGFDSWEFNDKTTFCCLVKSIEWTSTYIFVT